MRNISEKTMITAIVNYKCVGFFGKCIKSLSKPERKRTIDGIIERGWMTEEPFALTPEGDEVVKKNLALCQY